MATLTNTKIKDTYDGLLKTNDESVLDVSGVTLIEDGLGNASALSLGRVNNGVTITGALTASGLTYPTTDGTVAGQAIVTDAAGNLSFATVTTDTPNLQEVTDVSPSSTTNTITAKEFIAIGGSGDGVRIWEGNNYVASNIGIGGINTLGSITTGSNNTAIGGNAGFSITTGSQNVTVGSETLGGVTTGSRNMALGFNALNNINGNDNVGIGFASGKEYNDGVTTGNKTLGDQNIYIGTNTLSGDDDTDNEIVIGYGATGNGSNTATYGNSSITDHYFDGNVRGDYFIGDGSLLTNLPSSTTPTLDDVVTSAAGANVSSINLEINGADLGTITNSSNTLFGDGALASFTTGSSNTAIGSGALTATTGGAYNTAIGAGALDIITSGNSNTAVGYSALGNGATLDYNTAIGNEALFYISGQYNVALGHNAGKERFGGNKTLGDNNVYIGANTDSSAADTDNEIVIGANAVGNGSNSATYGDSNVTKHIFTGGNVGIGEQNPSRSIHISAATPAIRLEDSTANDYSELVSVDGDLFIRADEGATQADSSIRFQIDQSEKVRIDASGNVGIGEQNPAFPMHIKSSTDIVQYESTTNGLYNQYKSTVGIFGYVGSGSQTVSGGGTSDFGIQSPLGAMLFATGGNTERMRISSGGDVLINGISSLPSATVHGGAYKSSGAVDGGYFSNSTDRTTNWSHFLFYNSNGLVGSISTSGSATAYNTSSDYRLKENVVEMTGALDRVDALKPSRFNFIADADKTVDGFLAHEVQAIVPEAVTGEKDAVDEEGNPVYQGIDQSKLVPLLVGAIKELSAKVAALESQLNA